MILGDYKGTALITGASSGIGAEFARQLASQGYHLLLHGRREERLRDICSVLASKHGVKAEYVLADLSHPEELLLLEQRIRTTPDLEMLVNNAGFGMTESFLDAKTDALEAMIRTHVLASVRLTHAALPQMLEQRSGSVIIVSSVAGFMISPGNATYCATKAYLITFTESLHLELTGTGVRVQALCPGFTRTDFHSRQGMDTGTAAFKHFMPAEKVVRKSLRDLKKGKVVSIPGLRYMIAARAVGWIPRPLFYQVVRWVGNKPDIIPLPDRPLPTADPPSAAGSPHPQPIDTR